MQKKSYKSILVIIPTSDYCERLKLEGIVKYAKEKNGPHWSLRFIIGIVDENWMRRQSLDNLDGIIAYIQSVRERDFLAKARIPVVTIEDIILPDSKLRHRNFASVVCDHVAEGRIAARYFLDRHYRNFAFIGAERRADWSDLRQRGFADELADAGFDLHVFPPNGRLGKWLRKLPRPCALFAARDLRARQVLDAAEIENIAVPQDLAVLGVDDDEMMCTTAFPALSSIPTFDRSLGYSAAHLLSQMLSGKSTGGTISTRPAQVVTRTSTDADSIGDPFVARALEWIRHHLDGDLDAGAIARGIGYSKRALQYRTERSLGISLGESVKRMRLSAAKELLAGTTLPVSEVAERCGFSGTSHLSLRIRESTGMTPLIYRRHVSPLNNPRCETHNKVNA